MNSSQSLRRGRTVETSVVNSDPSQRHMMKRFSIQGFFRCLTTFWDFSKFLSKVSVKMWIHTVFLENVGEELSNKEMKNDAKLTNSQCTNTPLKLFQNESSFYTDGNLRSVLPFWYRTLRLKILLCVRGKAVSFLLFPPKKPRKLHFRNAKFLITNKQYTQYKLNAI